MYGSSEEVFQVYESKPRALTPEFIRNFAWSDVSKTPLNPEFIPVLLYMRDVEKFTEHYFKELKRTPTGRDPGVKKFMESWNAEEAQHGDLINRFLNEAGIPTEDDWFDRMKAEIPVSYKFRSYMNTTITLGFGQPFSATHMTWGAINELTTLQGYRRLIQLAGHPQLAELLGAIIKEEAIHIFFYSQVARIKLAQSGYARKLARLVIDKFWKPVGEGVKSAPEAAYLLKTLFGNTEGLDSIHQHVNQVVAGFPGFAGFTKVTDAVAKRISMSAPADFIAAPGYPQPAAY